MKDVKIYWTDASHQEEASVAGAFRLRPAKQVTRGALVNEEEAFITVAATSTPDGDADEMAHFRDLVCVPRGMITKVVTLSEGDQHEQLQ